MTREAAPRTDDKTQAPSRDPIDPIATLGVFVLAGPLFGYLAIFLIVTATMAFKEGIGPLLAAPVMAAAFAPFGLPIAYAMAWIPAIAAGISMAILDALSWPPRGRLLLAAVLGGVLACLWHLTGIDQKQVLEKAPDLAVFAAGGAVAALVCAKLSAVLSSRLDAKRE